MTLLLSRAGLLRPEAEAAIDAHFAAQINDLLGPMAALHSRKRYLAENGGGALIDGEADRQAILAKALEQDNQISHLDARRRALKAEVRAAATAAQIKTIIADL